MSTRRTYIAISGALHSVQHKAIIHGYEPCHRLIANAIADALQELHPSGFDRARFLKDAGVES